MIKYVDGNIIGLAKSGWFDVIAHGANCFCTMSSGLAPQIKENFPEAFAVDCETKKGDRAKLGTLSHTHNTKPVVCNLYTQFGFWGRKKGIMDLDYDALRSSVRQMKEKFSGKKFGLPMIGSKLAGGDWNIIEKIIEEEMVGEDVTVVRYKI